jgi:dephospho-CoA kinase
MKIICLVGEIGTGKTTVAKILENLGADVIYSDYIAKIVSSKSAIKSELVKFFGKKILYRNGRLNRKKLANIVFSNRDKLEKLNEIMLPQIVKEIKKILYKKEKLKKTSKPTSKKIKRTKKEDERIVVIEAPLLFMTNLYKICNEILYVTCPVDLRIERVASNMNLSEKEAKLRVEGQNLYIPIEKVNYIINNNKGMNYLKKEIKKYYKYIQDKY